MPSLRSLPLLTFALTLLACGSRSGGLSVSARGEGTPAAASVDLGNGISLDRVRVVVRKLELEGSISTMSASTAAARAQASRGDDDGEDGEGEVEIGPFLVDLSGDQLSGSVTKAFDASVPDGTYRELEITVGPAAGAAGTPLAEMGGSSVIVEGTRAASGSTAAAAFRLASPLTAKQELETRLVVDHAGTSSNVTLVLELRKWFTAADGSTLDPTVDADRSAIEGNIRASLHFERDDDGDGEDDDHGGHGGDDGPGHD